MNRKTTKILTLLLALIVSAFTLVGCNQEGQAKAEVVSKTETMIVIKASETQGFPTLLDAMKYLKDAGKLSFELSGGMVVSIEGKANDATQNAYWFCYTSDSEYSNTEWGTVEYDGKVLGSAILGAESLPVAVGEYYVWAYSKY